MRTQYRLPHGSAPGYSQEGTGASHEPKEKTNESIRVPHDPTNNSWRCWGVPLTQKQSRGGVSGHPLAPIEN